MPHYAHAHRASLSGQWTAQPVNMAPMALVSATPYYPTAGFVQAQPGIGVYNGNPGSSGVQSHSRQPSDMINPYNINNQAQPQSMQPPPVYPGVVEGVPVPDTAPPNY